MAFQIVAPQYKPWCAWAIIGQSIIASHRIVAISLSSRGMPGRAKGERWKENANCRSNRVTEPETGFRTGIQGPTRYISCLSTHPHCPLLSLSFRCPTLFTGALVWSTHFTLSPFGNQPLSATILNSLSTLTHYLKWIKKKQHSHTQRECGGEWGPDIRRPESQQMEGLELASWRWLVAQVECTAPIWFNSLRARASLAKKLDGWMCWLWFWLWAELGLGLIRFLLYFCWFFVSTIGGYLIGVYLV